MVFFGNGSGEVAQPDRRELSSGIDPDKLIGFRDAVAQKAHDAIDVDKLKEGDFFMSYKERFNRTPGPDNKDVSFIGARGESKAVPNPDTERGSLLRDKLAEFGQDGIEYWNALPDFGPVSVAKVEIGHMTSDRSSNFTQAYEKVAEKWNEEGKDNRTDWKASEVKDWKEGEGLTIHEDADRKTCYFVPYEIHDSFRHSGGRAECAHRDGETLGGKFDD